MNRSRATMIVTMLLAVIIGVWVSRNTEWVSIRVPMPLRGEAARNPFYGAQRFAEALGALTYWDRTLQTPRPDAVIVLSGWHWSLSERRRLALERWVASGGRLVVDRSVVNDAGFEAWSGIAAQFRKIDDDTDDSTADDVKAADDDSDSVGDAGSDAGFLDGANHCIAVRETIAADGSAGDPPITFQLCDTLRWMSLASTPAPAWELRDDVDTLQAVRVAVGRGSVTVLNASPFRVRALLDGDHGRIFVAATQLRRGDMVRFLSEANHPSLLALLWQQGAPAVLLTLTAIGLALWRGAARFGPLAPPESTARRSLAEQILGTGQFALRRGDGEALHASVVRGLDDAARRRVPGYGRLAGRERATALARLTGMDDAAIDAALHDASLRRPERLRGTIALLELARRRTLVAHTRSSHGAE